MVGFTVIAVAIIVVGLAIAWAIQGLTGRGVTEPALPPEPRTPALVRDGFNPGHIIDDELFFDAKAMTEDDVRDFIEKVGKGCRPGPDGTPCLQDYVTNSMSFPADHICPEAFVGKTGDTAASIITKAAQACGINPAVLLVTLQKEQGLLTASSDRLTPRRYDIAMGYACPDTGPCRKEFEGFAKQVYYAARQLVRYGLEDNKYDFYAQQAHSVQFNKNPKCGAAVVFIENRATAALYNYTPYQPTAQVIAGGTGPCASWGNINFYSYYSAWFGDPVAQK